jgi:hypothetical protein
MSFIDRYGRLQVPNFLRKEIKLEGEIAISQGESYLESRLGR